MSQYKLRLIELLLKHGILKWSPRAPITFKSGIKSPIYFDFRDTGKHLDLYNHICDGFMQAVEGQGFEGVAGVATGAIQYASNVGPRLNLQFGYVRPDPKDHGMGKQIDGLEVSGKIIALFEDLVSTAGSVLKAAKALKDAGARKVVIFSVFTYKMPISQQELSAAGYELCSLIDINDVLSVISAKTESDFSDKDIASLKTWIDSPSRWFEENKYDFDMGYLTKLRTSARDNKSLVCFGLDPVLAALPNSYAAHGIVGYGKFINDLFAEMNSRGLLPGAIKPNLGFYEVHDKKRKGGTDGTDTLARILFLAEMYKVPTILDSKDGDIGKSSANYASLSLKNWGADATTVPPYMGDDSVLPFAAYCNATEQKGAYVLTCTSNSGAKTIQMEELRKFGFVYDKTIDMILSFAKKSPGIGAVVGATHAKQRKEIIKRFVGSDVALLFPGVGDQGASATDVVMDLIELGYERDLARINSSSKLTHSWYKDSSSVIPEANEAIEICINGFTELNNEINKCVFANV